MRRTFPLHAAADSRGLALHIPLRGAFEARQGGEWLSVAPGSALVVATAGETRRRWEGSSDLLNIMVDRDALDQSVTREAFAGPDGVLQLPPLTLIDFSEAATLARFVELIIRDLETEQSAFSDPAVGVEAERVLLQLLLRSMRQEAERRPLRERYRIVPAYMRRAERFIREHHCDPLDIATIAQGSGVSARTLQYGFRKYRGASPMAFLRDVRLSAARRALADGRGRSIRELAETIGYASQSQLAEQLDVDELVGPFNPDDFEGQPGRLFSGGGSIERVVMAWLRGPKLGRGFPRNMPRAEARQRLEAMGSAELAVTASEMGRLCATTAALQRTFGVPLILGRLLA
jgi:AraC-like DNA-binding protein